MFVIKLPQCKTSFVASLICKCTVLDLWRIDPHCHHTQPKIHEIHSTCGGCVNNLVLLAACESSNWLLQKLQFSFGVLEMDMECLGSLFSFPLKILEILFLLPEFKNLCSRTDCWEMAQWARGLICKGKEHKDLDLYPWRPLETQVRLCATRTPVFRRWCGDRCIRKAC